MKQLVIIAIGTAMASSLMSTSCENEQYSGHTDFISVAVTNNTDEPIYVVDWADDTELLSPSLVFYNVPYLADQLKKIDPGETDFNAGNMPHYHDFVAHDTIIYQLIVFSQTTLDSYTKSQLVEENIHDGLYSFSRKEMEFIDYHITYPLAR